MRRKRPAVAQSERKRTVANETRHIIVFLTLDVRPQSLVRVAEVGGERGAKTESLATLLGKTATLALNGSLLRLVYSQISRSN